MNIFRHAVFTFFLCVFFVFISTNNLFAQNAKDSIIIVFNNLPKYPMRIEAAKQIFIYGSYPIISIEDNFHTILYEPDSTKLSDTLKIKPSSSFIMLKHSFNTVSFMYYLFEKGDTVIFSYQNNIPIAKVINRTTKKYDINFDLFWRNKMKDSSYTAYEIFLAPFFTDNKADQEDIVNTRYKVKDKNYYLAESSFLWEIQFLDSVKTKGDISEEYYRFFIDKCKYLAATIKLEQFGIDSAKNILPPDNSSLLPYSFYYNFITSIVKITIENKAKVIVQSNGQIADYGQIFDVIEKDKKIKSPYKDLLLYYYLNEIANNFSIQEFESYFNRFQKISKDSFLIADIKSRYPRDLSKVKNSLTVISKTKTKYNLTDIIAKNKGKLIYVDFWASWCLPCRAAMPASMQLRKKYKAKNIVFIYLSIYDEFDSWLKANREEGLEEYPNSYFILYSQTNKFLKKINLTSIPRYLLYNKKGKLINQNAPRPTNQESEKLINAYLK